MSRGPYPILMYHWFHTGGPSASRSPQLEITPELFERQMAALQHEGYHGVTLGTAIDADGSPAHPRPVVLTFDDGTADFVAHALPILDRFGFRATLFVVPDYVGTTSSWDEALGEPARPLMSWDDLRALREAGFEIGSHTQRHRPLVDLPDDEARDTLLRSRERIGDRLGSPPRFVAYPRGFYHEAHKRMAHETGYEAACAVILRWRDLLASDDYDLKRMTIKGTESMRRFRMRLFLASRARYRRWRAR